MKRSSIRSLLFLFLLTPIRLDAAPQAGSLPPDALKKIEEFVQAQMTQQKIPGLTLAIAGEGEIRYSKAFGMADLENGLPAKTTTVFRTASVAKPLTATAVMQLTEAGKLDLDAPIQKYCPAFPEKPWPVTARLLLGHLAGVRHYEKPGESTGTEHFFTLTDSLRLFKDDPLKQEPGTKFHYSTFGYSVLGCAVEGASGKPYLEYMREKVFQPAGMARTRDDHHYELVGDRARGYLRMDEETLKSLPAAAKERARVGEIYNASLHDTSMKVPGGGLLSTAEDLVRFLLALQAGKLVKAETLAQMWTNLRTKDGQTSPYGLGWNVPPSQQGKLVVHTGGQAGTTTVVAYWRDQGICLALMTNRSGVPILRWMEGISEILRRAP